MITAVFKKAGDRLTGFTVSGHAMQGRAGNDVCCAAVSSAAMLVCNALTDFLGSEAKADCGENTLSLDLEKGSREAYRLLEAFYTHLEFIGEEYPGGIRVITK